MESPMKKTLITISKKAPNWDVYRFENKVSRYVIGY